MTAITLEQRARELLAEACGAQCATELHIAVGTQQALRAIEAALRLSAGADWIVARQHRGSLEDSMATAARIPATEAELREFFAEPTGELLVAPYGWDQRVGWDTHIVTIDGEAIGFINGALPAAPRHDPDDALRGDKT